MSKTNKPLTSNQHTIDKLNSLFNIMVQLKQLDDVECTLIAKHKGRTLVIAPNQNLSRLQS